MNEQLAYVQVTGELLNIKQKLNIISVSRSSKSAKIAGTLLTTQQCM